MKAPSGGTAKTNNGRVWNAMYDLEGEWLVPHKCPCCVKCWLKVSANGIPITSTNPLTGETRLHCVHGGPYKGYVEILDP